MLYWRAPNTEAGENTAYNNVRVGRPQHREIGTPISTGNASWRGPNTEIGTPISTGNTSWGETEINFVKYIFVLLPLSFYSIP